MTHDLTIGAAGGPRHPDRSGSNEQMLGAESCTGREATKNRSTQFNGYRLGIDAP